MESTEPTGRRYPGKQAIRWTLAPGAAARIFALAAEGTEFAASMWRVFAAINEAAEGGGLSQAEIRRNVRYSHPTVSRGVNALARRGLIRNAKDFEGAQAFEAQESAPAETERRRRARTLWRLLRFRRNLPAAAP